MSVYVYVYVYCILYIENCILYIVYSILWIVDCIMYIVDCRLYMVYGILYIVYAYAYIYIDVHRPDVLCGRVQCNDSMDEAILGQSLANDFVGEPWWTAGGRGW